MELPQTFEVVENPAPLAVIAFCIDPRFRKAIDAIPCKVLGLKENEFILMKLGGGPTPLAYPTVMKSRCKVLMRQILFTCKNFPSIVRVILISHQNCKYYTQFPCSYHGPEKEKRDLPFAGSLMQPLLPNQKVELYHAAFTKSGKRIVCEEVQVSPEVRTPPADWIRSYQHS